MQPITGQVIVAVPRPDRRAAGLVSRRHIDLQRVAGALCRRTTS